MTLQGRDKVAWSRVGGGGEGKRSESRSEFEGRASGRADGLVWDVRWGEDPMAMVPSMGLSCGAQRAGPRGLGPGKVAILWDIWEEVLHRQLNVSRSLGLIGA